MSTATKTPFSSEYEPMGRFTTLSNFRIYAVGSHEADRGIVLIADDLSPHRLQAADMLAQIDNTLVLVPDYANHEALGFDKLGSNPEEKKARFHEFIINQARLQGDADITKGVIGAARVKNPGVKSWGVFGLCSCLKVPAPLSMDGGARTGYMIPLIPSCIMSVLDTSRGRQ